MLISLGGNVGKHTSAACLICCIWAMQMRYCLAARLLKKCLASLPNGLRFIVKETKCSTMRTDLPIGGWPGLTPDKPHKQALKSRETTQAYDREESPGTQAGHLCLRNFFRSNVSIFWTFLEYSSPMLSSLSPKAILAFSNGSDARSKYLLMFM